MPTLINLKKMLQNRYQELMGDLEENPEDLVPLLYAEESPINPNTHLRSDERNLLVYLLAKQMGFDDEQEIAEDFIDNISTQLIYAPNFNSLRLGVNPHEAARLADHKNNSKFKKLIREFLDNDIQQSKSLVVSASTLKDINESHFVEYSFEKEPGDNVLTVKIKDSILADKEINDSPEIAWQKEIIRSMIPEGYQLNFVIAPVTSQDAADCLIHAVNNDLQEQLKVRHELDKEKIAQIRQGVYSALSTGVISDPEPMKVHSVYALEEEQEDYNTTISMGELAATWLESSEQELKGQEKQDWINEKTKLIEETKKIVSTIKNDSVSPVKAERDENQHLSYAHLRFWKKLEREQGQEAADYELAKRLQAEEMQGITFKS